MTESARTGLILRIDAKVCQVEIEGKREQLPLRGRLFEFGARRPVAVGDRVKVAQDKDGGVIEEVLPRSSKLSRSGGPEGDEEKIVATNISKVLVVSSIREPAFHPLLVDRILAGAARQELPVALVISKMDRDKKGAAGEWIELYRSLGYEVYPCSITAGKETSEELEALRTLLHANVSVLSGLSGVGKSSLINHLIPGLELRIGSLSRIRQGKHTTTSTQLIALPGGGHVLDTPGIRNFMLFSVGTQELSFYFPEMRELVHGCEYRDCTHLQEGSCAIRQALEEGRIHPSRYDSYRSIYADIVGD
ncbi:MAG: ribosome small subunit-dependent GTPase A [Planctomycetota bacterium]